MDERERIPHHAGMIRLYDMPWEMGNRNPGPRNGVTGGGGGLLSFACSLSKSSLAIATLSMQKSLLVLDGTFVHVRYVVLAFCEIFQRWEGSRSYFPPSPR